MTESDIRRIVREELEAERALVAAERKAAKAYIDGTWEIIRDEIDRRIKASGQDYCGVSQEVIGRFERDPTFLRNA